MLFRLHVSHKTFYNPELGELSSYLLKPKTIWAISFFNKVVMYFPLFPEHYNRLNCVPSCCDFNLKNWDFVQLIEN